MDAHAGRVRVEILDEDGKAIPGFCGKDVPAYQGVDQLRLAPHWRDSADLSALVGRVVRLRFHLANAELYAFQIQ